jgi:hypothetical protein
MRSQSHDRPSEKKALSLRIASPGAIGRKPKNISTKPQIKQLISKFAVRAKSIAVIISATPMALITSGQSRIV